MITKQYIEEKKEERKNRREILLVITILLTVISIPLLVLYIKAGTYALATTHILLLIAMWFTYQCIKGWGEALTSWEYSLWQWNEFELKVTELNKDLKEKIKDEK